MRWLNCTLMVVVALGLASCEPGFLEGQELGCMQALGTWDVDNQFCLPAPPDENFLMVQDAQGVAFSIDETVNADCPAEAFWSAAMTMTGAGSETLFFSDRPYRHAYTQSTAEFVSAFADTFSQATGGNPNAVLNWEDATTMMDQRAVLELSSPTYEASTETLTYRVCGLRLDDPETLMPLPDDQQVRPAAMPTAVGEFSLFIDDVSLGVDPVCGDTEETTNCYWWGICGVEGWSLGSCADEGIPTLDYSEECRSYYRLGVGDRVSILADPYLMTSMGAPTACR